MAFAVTAAYLIGTVSGARADIFGDALHAIGGAAQTGARLVTAPVQTVINAVKSPTLSSVTAPWKAVGSSAAGTIDAAASLSNAPQQFLYDKAKSFASLGGSAGSFIFDVGTFQQNLIRGLEQSGVHDIANTLRLQNPLQVTAAPLAAAIRAAHDRYNTDARPIPDDVKAKLAAFIDAGTLQRGRFTIGNVEITLPSLIGNGSRFFGGDRYAVTVDDIIVFPVNAGTDYAWWAHELTHVGQYKAMGIDAFAYRYVVTLGHELEDPAYAKQDQVAASLGLQNVSRANTASAFGQLNATMQGSSGSGLQPIPEHFVAQCIFPNDPHPVSFLITNTNRIIMTLPSTGQWVQIGWAMPRRFPAFAWTYQCGTGAYDVDANGVIVAPVVPAPGYPPRPVAVGYVVKL